MLELDERPHWADLIGPLSEASLALGRLHQALRMTSLYPAWRWRETVRCAVKIAQNAGYRVSIEQLTMDLAGVPLRRSDEDVGIAAGRRVFLLACRLFRAAASADSEDPGNGLWEAVWGTDERSSDEPGRAGGADDRAHGPAALLDLARSMVRDARQAQAPLVGVVQGLRTPRSRRLPPTEVRLLMPLALHLAGFVPRIAPALLGGRLPLNEPGPLTPWLVRAVTALDQEAVRATARLEALQQQHRAWQRALAGQYHRNARSPAVLGLLAATPVLSASLVARHLGCTPQGAGLILNDFSAKGIVRVATTRRRWRIYVAADLAPGGRAGAGEGWGLPLAEDPTLPLDEESIDRTLGALLDDLDGANRRVQAALARAGEGLSHGTSRRRS